MQKLRGQRRVLRKQTIFV